MCVLLYSKYSRKKRDNKKCPPIIIESELCICCVIIIDLTCEKMCVINTRHTAHTVHRIVITWNYTYIMLLTNSDANLDFPVVFLFVCTNLLFVKFYHSFNYMCDFKWCGKHYLLNEYNQSKNSTPATGNLGTQPFHSLFVIITPQKSWLARKTSLTSWQPVSG